MALIKVALAFTVKVSATLKEDVTNKLDYEAEIPILGTLAGVDSGKTKTVWDDVAEETEHKAYVYAPDPCERKRKSCKCDE